MHGKLEMLHSQLQLELDKFFGKGVKVAGTRARILCQELKAVASEIRKDIQTAKETLKNER